MIFDVTPEQVSRLQPKQFAELLRRLLFSEARATNVALSGVSVPLKITVADGGEDGRISWRGGADSTDYLPHRFCMFQVKASTLSPSSWKKEVWSKASRGSGKQRKLAKAVQITQQENGAYIGFTTADTVQARVDEIEAALREGIVTAGGTVAEFAAIKIYNAEKIALWCTKHPAVAVWVNEQATGLSLKGFQSIEQWGVRLGAINLVTVEDKKPRFVLTKANKRIDLGTDALTADQAATRIAEEIKQSPISVRVYGPSGVGKSRFVFDALNAATSMENESQKALAIFCDFRDVGNALNTVVKTLADTGSEAVLVVDECPRDIAIRLAQLNTSTTSKLRILTIDLDERPIEGLPCLNLFVNPSDDELVRAILRQRLPSAPPSEIDFAAEQAKGFPRIAVLVAETYKTGRVYRSLEDLVERILRGLGITLPDQIRAIECLALFDELGFEDDVASQMDEVAEKLARMRGDEMYEHLSRAIGHSIVQKKGNFLKAHPDPIAAFLGLRRLAALRVSTIEKFFGETRCEPLVHSFLTRARFFDTSEVAKQLSRRFLSSGGRFGSLETLGSSFEFRCLDALVHIVPDDTMDAIERVFGSLSLDELGERGRARGLLSALEKLAFRRQTFGQAARLMVRLAAVAEDDQNNPALEIVERLFRLRLSGTEAVPLERFIVIDEALTSPERRILSVCIRALGSTLSGSFGRPVGAERIGSAPPLEDWQPRIWKDVFDFRREGIRRLGALAVAESHHAKASREVLASHLRNLMSPNLFDELAVVLKDVQARCGLWLEPIKTIGDWLYFDSEKSPHDFRERVKGLYRELLPKNALDQALLYTKFWSADIRDPDEVYRSDKHDYEYSSRKAREVARSIAVGAGLLEEDLRLLLSSRLNNVYPFAHELGLSSHEPEELYRKALSVSLKVSAPNLQFLRGLLAGIDQRDEVTAAKLLNESVQPGKYRHQSISFFTAVRITPDRVAEIAAALQERAIEPSDVIRLSYGRGLDHLAPDSILPLLDQLIGGDAGGLWAALEVVSMYQHGRQEFDSALAKRVSAIVVKPELLQDSGRVERDAHHFDGAFTLLRRFGYLGSDMATGLAKQIILLCKLDDSDTFFALDSSFRAVIEELAVTRPQDLWSELSLFALSATPGERHWLDELIGPGRSFDESSDQSGPLFKMPLEIMLPWAAENAPVRVPFLFAFVPILITEPDGRREWHPVVKDLIKQYGHLDAVRSALADRIEPTTWSGSLVPYLEVFLGPLEGWFNHPTTGVATWARRAHRSLERQIERERASEE